MRLFALTPVLVAVAMLAGCKPSEPGVVQLQPAPGADLQPLWQIPDFKLLERSGTPIALADLKGKVWIADFFYTTCPGPCPMMTSRLSELHKMLKDEPDVRLVSISTDPAKDTPDMLKQYAERFGASERWLFLTGEKPEIFRLANEGFKLSLVETPEHSEPITHSTKLVLIDRNGTIRGLYEGVGEEDLGKMVDDVRRLVKE